MPERAQTDRLEQAGLVLWAVAVVVAPWLIGAVHWPVALALCVMMLASSALITLARMRAGSQARISTLSMTWALGAIWSALQIVPWPAFLVRVLSPARWDAYQSALAAGITEEAFLLIPSLDPGATADMALRFLALWAATWAVENMSMRLRQSKRLLAIPAASALCALCVGLLQPVVSPELFLGFYEAERAPLFGSTFVNGNQASALSALGAGVWLVLACARGFKRQRYRALCALCALLCLGGVALQESMGVWIALGASVVAGSIYHAVVRRGGMRSVMSRVLVIASVVVACASAWGFAIHHISRDRQSLDARAEMVRAALAASLDSTWLGSGAWSVERALGATLDWHVVGLTRIETIEAELIEWTLTLGWPVALMMWLGILISWAGPLGRTHLRARRGAAVFGLGLFVVLTAQMHFPFFMLGLGLPMVAAWCAVREQALVRRTRRESDQPERRTPPPEQRGTLSWFVVGLKVSRRVVLASSVCALLVMGLSTYRLVSAPGRILGDEIDAMPIERVRHMGTYLPTESQLYVKMATDPSLEQDAATQRELFARAYHFEPTLPYEMLWGRALWRDGEREQAREVMTRVLMMQGFYAYERGLGVMLDTVEESRDRAAIVEPGGRALWVRTWRAIDKVQGEERAQDFLNELVALREQDVQPYEVLVDFYIAKRRWELLDLYIQLWSMWEFEDRKRGQEMLWRARLEQLSAQRKQDELVSAVVSQIDLLSRSATLSRYVLAIAPTLLEREDAELLRPHIDHASERLCVGESLLENRDTCEVYRASRLEHEGKLERAEEVWKQRARRRGSWQILGDFYERHSMCTSLRLLIKQVSQGMIHEGKERSDAANARLIKALEARHARCIHVE